MSTQCLQTAGNNVKLFTCVFDSDDLGAELEAPPPVAFPRRCTVSVRRGKPRKGAGGRGGVEGRGRRRGSLRRRKIFFEGRFSAPKMRRPNKINGFAGSVPNRVGVGRKRSLKLVTQSPCRALPNFATIGASTRQTRSKRCMTSIARLGSSHLF